MWPVPRQLRHSLSPCLPLPWQSGQMFGAVSLRSGGASSPAVVRESVGSLCSTPGLLRDLAAGYVHGELAVMRALAAGDAQGVHDGLSQLGYVAEPGLEPNASLE